MANCNVSASCVVFLLDQLAITYQ